MNFHEEERDVWLEDLLSEPELEGKEFSSRILNRVARRRMVVRGLNGTLFLAGVVCVWVVLRLTWDQMPLQEIELRIEYIFAFLGIFGLFGLLWLDTESRCISCADHLIPGSSSPNT